MSSDNKNNCSIFGTCTEKITQNYRFTEVSSRQPCSTTPCSYFSNKLNCVAAWEDCRGTEWANYVAPVAQKLYLKRKQPVCEIISGIWKHFCSNITL